MHADTLIEALKVQLLQKQENNPKYSMRMFARELDLSPSEISEIFNGKRKISPAKMGKIISHMKMAPYKRANLERKVFTNQDTQEAKEIKEDEFTHISNPSYFAFLTLMTSTGFQSDITWIAEKLDLKVFDVYQITYRLKKLGLIEDVDGKLVKKHANVTTTDDIPSEAIRESHRKDMDIARSALDEIPVELRDFSALTILLDPKKMSQAKQILRKAQDDIEDLMKDSDPQEVYKICTYLFPISK